MWIFTPINGPSKINYVLLSNSLSMSMYPSLSPVKRSWFNVQRTLDCAKITSTDHLRPEMFMIAWEVDPFPLAHQRDFPMFVYKSALLDFRCGLELICWLGSKKVSLKTTINNPILNGKTKTNLLSVQFHWYQSYLL